MAREIERMRREAEYFCKDFEWEELRAEIEAKACFGYHLLPFEAQPSSSAIQLQAEADADANAWDRFHSRHSSGKFFKERRYLVKEFPELLSCGENKVLEVGCGNGSTALPILRANKNAIVYACDCSTKSLERAHEVIGSAKIDSFEDRFHTFCCDVSTEGFPQWLACNSCQNKLLQNQSNCMSESKEGHELRSTNACSPKECHVCIGGVDFETLIFTLSAVPMERMLRSIKECFAVLKPGGMVFFRDYGLYDMTMLRFEQAKRVGFREYKRSDGTRSYFFCLDTVRNLFVGAGFTELELNYCCVKSVNRRRGKSMRRVWVHGKFQKPRLV